MKAAGVVVCLLGQMAWGQARYPELSFHIRGHTGGTILYPQVVGTKSAPDTARAYALHNQAVQLEEQGRFSEAEVQFREALRCWEALSLPERLETAVTLNALGNLLRIQGRTLEAEPLIRRAISIGENTQGVVRLNLAVSLSSLGALYCNQHEPARAIPLLQRAIQIREELLGPDDPLIAGSLDNLADAYTQQRRFAEAEAQYQRALQILEPTKDHQSLRALTNYDLAEFYFRHAKNKSRKLSQAEALYRRSLALWKESPDREHPFVGKALSALAEVYMARRRYSDAEPLLIEALTMHEKAVGPAHRQVAEVLSVYAVLLRKLHRGREAAAMKERAENIRRAFDAQHPGPGTVDVKTLQSPR